MSTPGSLALREKLSRLKRRLLGTSGLLAIVLLALLWFRGRQSSTSPPPAVPGEDITTTDPEIKTTIESARAAVLREPNSGVAWGNLGQTLHAHNFLSPALVCYTEAERHDARNPDWLYLRAAILLAGPEPAHAILDLRRSMELGCVDQLSRLRLSELFLDQGRFEEAAEELRRTLEIDPFFPRANLQLAQVALARQDWNGCLRHLEAVGDNPYARKQACSLRLIAHQRFGNVQSAQREQDLLRQLPDDLPWPDAILDRMREFQVGLMARIGRAKAMFTQGETAAILSLLLRTVCDYPESDLAWVLLGRILFRVGDPAAEDVLWKSVELAPDKADVWASLGFVRLNHQNPVGALECYRTVNRLKPTDADAHLKVGECLEATGDRSGASAAYRQALRYQPDFREAQERLEKLNSER